MRKSRRKPTFFRVRLGNASGPTLPFRHRWSKTMDFNNRISSLQKTFQEIFLPGLPVSQTCLPPVPAPIIPA